MDKAGCSARLQLGHRMSQAKRVRPLSVSAVGSGSKQALYDATLSVACLADDDRAVNGAFTAPVVPNAGLTGLVGLDALERLRAVVDFITGVMNLLLSPGDHTLAEAFPPGTSSFKFPRRRQDTCFCLALTWHQRLMCHRTRIPLQLFALRTALVSSSPQSS